MVHVFDSCPNFAVTPLTLITNLPANFNNNHPNMIILSIQRQTGNSLKKQTNKKERKRRRSGKRKREAKHLHTYAHSHTATLACLPQHIHMHRKYIIQSNTILHPMNTKQLQKNLNKLFELSTVPVLAQLHCVPLTPPNR